MRSTIAIFVILQILFIHSPNELWCRVSRKNWPKLTPHKKNIGRVFRRNNNLARNSRTLTSTYQCKWNLESYGATDSVTCPSFFPLYHLQMPEMLPELVPHLL